MSIFDNDMFKKNLDLFKKNSINIFEKNEDTTSINLYLIQIFTICIIAMPIIIVDIKFQKYREKNKLSITKRLFIVFLQILIGAIYIFLLYRSSPELTNTFQTTLAGMFFAGIFYSLQGTLFNEIRDISLKMV